MYVCMYVRVDGQVQAAQSEREAVQSQLDAAEEINRGWKSKIQQMEQVTMYVCRSV